MQNLKAFAAATFEPIQKTKQENITLMKKLLLLSALIVLAAGAKAQETQPATKSDELYDLSLEQLMNIPISSASKKDETLFDAPLSSYTITRAEIDRAGSTSIVEALRLSPGIIVREQSNGVYDVHIRGMENLTRTNGEFLKGDAYTLVMIDSRPVFNHGLGGTYWESLPVDINDVERIEIVRGPSSALFGPNAVTGVINIITKRAGEKKAVVSANAQAGTLGTAIGNVSLGKAISDKFSVMVTGNFQERHRADADYYNQNTGTYVPLNVLYAGKPQSDIDAQYPHPSQSLKKAGINGYLTYKMSEKTEFDLSLSTQSADYQKIFISNPLIGGTTRNTAANLAIKSGGLKIRTSYLDGYAADIKTVGTFTSQYDFNVADANGEYEIKFGPHYSLTPGLSYQKVTFDDTKQTDPANGKVGLFHAKNTITTQAAFVRSDLNFTKNLRVLAGLRADQFSVPNKTYVAYELAGTYKIGAKNLVRAAVTRSNSGSFMGYNYLNIGGGIIGNQDLKLFTLNMIEVGFRSKITENFQIDFDVFQQDAKNLTAIMQMSVGQQMQNTPTTASQIGATLSLNIVPNEKIQFKPFITLQKTQTKDLPSLYLDPAIVPGLVTYSASEHKYTPGSFGGFYFNYRPVSKLNINLNSYYYSKQTQYDGSAATPGTPQYAYSQISGKFILSAKVSYEVMKNLNVFVNGRNALNSATREFYAADRTAGLYTIGASFNLN